MIMEQEQKIDMEFIKKEIKAALVLQCNAIIKQGQLANIEECIQTLNEGLNIGSSKVGDAEFTAMIVGYGSGWLSAKGTDVVALDLDILDIVEEVVVEWAAELGIDIS
jgi:hypothetical protein